MKETWTATRQTLLGRIKDLDDNESWRDFFAVYSPLIYRTALKAGLDRQEAEEVVQQTFVSVAKKMPGFTYDPAKDSSKGWLLKLTHWRIINQFKQRKPEFKGQPKRDNRDEARTSTVDRIPDPNTVEWEASWESDWKENLVSVGLDRLKHKIKPKHFEIYYLRALKGLPACDVSKRLRVSIATVYLVTHRVAARLKKEIKRLESGKW